VHESLRQMPNFSLDELLRTFSGKREDLQPVPNVDASIAIDMQVFDLVTKQSPEWIRLWVVKKSELPVRIRSINPSFGNQIEAVFDYFTAMPDEAFDPAKVQSAIRAKQGSANRLYALLKDPGGRPLTPEDLFAKAGLHLPQLATVGRTAEGVVWVQSHKAGNQSADGRRFDGWGKLTDNLGQEYLRMGVGQRLEGDLHEECYIPLNYRAGYQKPASYTLTCWDRERYERLYWQDRPTTIVGSVEVKQWTDGAPVPKLFDDQPGLDTDGFTRTLLSHLASLEEWERFDALAATIPGAAEDHPLALYRDILLSRKLDLIRQREQAVTLRARLFPLVKDRVKNGTSDEWELIESHLADLVRAGQREAARPLANRFVADLPVQREIYIGQFIYKLHEAGMTLEDIRKFFDEDILNLPRVKEDLGRMSAFQNEIQNPSNDPRFAAWRGYVEKLAVRYRDQALPAECEFIESDFVAPSGQAVSAVPLPGHPEYSVGIWAPVPPETLGYSAAAYRKLDPSLITVSPNVKEKAAVCVSRTAMNWPNAWAAYLKFQGIDTIEKSTRRTVLVAQYDGRILPNRYQVTPLNCSQFGTVLAVGRGGVQNNTTDVLDSFAQAMNFGMGQKDPRKILILNETGLPDEPGANQSAANVCLVYDFAFWAGPEATLMATDWFRDNFGITFHKEEREVKAIELQPAK
jgi:hypothetical protein